MSTPIKIFIDCYTEKFNIIYFYGLEVLLEIELIVYTFIDNYKSDDLSAQVGIPCTRTVLDPLLFLRDA